uniref:Uncharacterized protein n=1 Tax=Chenopodium quinoa TaxID=63459 RepID=A0A803N1G9_CHEQI
MDQIMGDPLPSLSSYDLFNFLNNELVMTSHITLSTLESEDESINYVALDLPCRDLTSVLMLLQGLRHFEKVSGLQANRVKFELYHANMSNDDLGVLSQRFWFKLGSWPFRLVLVSSVLMSLCSYWMQIMVILVAFINAINKIYRKFLWEGKLDGSKIGYVKWDHVCLPKKGQGHFVGEVDSFYVKDFITGLEVTDWWPQHGQEFSIARAYKAITEQGQRVKWDSVVWNRLSIPKHRFN